MKWYRICFFILVVVVFGFLTVGFFYTEGSEKKAERHMTSDGIGEKKEDGDKQENLIQTELLAEYKKIGKQLASEEAIPVNQSPNEVEAAQGEYYLVEENGFLLVFCKDKTTLCLHTHMPASDFPAEEQAKLMEGIWFASMLDVFNYLESYTS